MVQILILFLICCVYSKNNKVFSFEASSTTFKDLKNIDLNKLQNIQPINLAISETKDLEIFLKRAKMIGKVQ